MQLEITQIQYVIIIFIIVPLSFAVGVILSLIIKKTKGGEKL